MPPITYDPAKRDAALQERGLHFEDAEIVFEGVTVDRFDRRFDYGETRIVTIGRLDGRMGIVVWTPRGDARHVISMRKANAREQARYKEQLEEAR